MRLKTTQWSIILPLFFTITLGALPTLNNDLLKGTLNLEEGFRTQSKTTLPVKPGVSFGKQFEFVGGAALPNARVDAFKPTLLEPTLAKKLPQQPQLATFASVAEQKLQLEDAALKVGSLADGVTAGFGPHLLTDPEAIKLSEFADVMEEMATNTVARLGAVSRAQKSDALSSISANVLQSARSKLSLVNRVCPFQNKPRCNSASKYRTADGSCNNKRNSLWGKALTAFERLLPPFYDDDVGTPRKKSINGGLLPNPRKLSFKIHDALPTQDNTLSHFTMEFGQFVSHDIQMNALSKGYRGGNLNCCGTHRRHRNCLPIDIPSDDPYFRQHGTTCINFVRALAAPPLDCRLGVRQQLNQVTHFLDGSTIYGSSQSRQNELRTRSKGQLRSTSQSGARDLLPQDPSAVCRTSFKCFKSGDVRSNQQPLLMSLHTIWMREHNRVAKEMSKVNPSWNDEKLFQEARKFVTAELQHIVYNEFLPLIIGPDLVNNFGLKPKPANQYYTGYDDQVKPQIRNGFMSAAYRFGHSMIRDNIKSSSPGSSPVLTLKDVMLKADLVYKNGVTKLTKGMYEQANYKVDKYMSHQVTRHLFQTRDGNGIDLAAANINRGRDHGTPDYNTWRLACNLPMADDFAQLTDHSPSVRALLQREYSSVNDIDFFTGGISENPVTNGAIGPTFACIVGLQFLILKKGDRFFYESNTDVKFTPAQLNEIKKATMSKIVCDNTELTQVPANMFKQLSGSNRNKACNSFQSPSFTPWKDCVDGGWSNWSPWRTVGRQGCRQITSRTRQCNNPSPSSCGQRCAGPSVERKITGSIFDFGAGCTGLIEPIGPIRPIKPVTIGPIRDFPRDRFVLPTRLEEAV